MSLTKVTNSMILGAQVNALDFMPSGYAQFILAGDAASQTASVTTAAIRAAMTYVYTTFGGGTVYCPAGVYHIENLQFVDVNAVVISGDSAVFNYGNYTGGGTKFKVATTATYGIWSRYSAAVMPNGSLNGIENLFISPQGSNGSVDYGYVCSVSSSFARNISCINFKLNFTAWGLNSNRFDSCSWGYATLCGYSVLSDNIADLEYQAPSLWALMTATEKTTSSSSTLWLDINSNIRVSLFGMILRGGGGGRFINTVIEGNSHQGLILFGAKRTQFVNVYVEGNNNAVAAATDADGVFPLKSSVSTYMVGSVNGPYGVNDLGFDIIIGEAAESTSLSNLVHDTQFNVFDGCFLLGGLHTTNGIRMRSGMGNTFNNLFYADDGDNLVVLRLQAVNTCWNNTQFKFDGSGGPNYEFFNIPMNTGTNTTVFDGQKIPFWRGANVTSTPNSPPTNWYSIGIGRGTLQASTNGDKNVVIGEGDVGGLMAASSNCTLVGYSTGVALVSGSQHTCVGAGAGNGLTTGANNLMLGYQAGTASSPSGALTTQSNHVCVGNSSISNAFIQVAWTVVSDERDKIIDAPVPYGLDFVCQLNPVIGKMNNRSRYLDNPDAKDGELADSNQRLMFTAQDVLAAELACGSESGIIVNDSDSENLKLVETAMIPVLVRAIKELRAEFDSYKQLHP